MHEPFDTVEYRGHAINLYSDDSPQNPREDSNVGIMVCFSKRYELGDKHTYKHNAFDGWDDIERHLTRVEGAVEVLPLYLYDHSGITISTHPFSCPWDSGRIGFIYATRKSVEQTLGSKRLTKATRQRIREALVSEVKLYDKYLRGDFCGYRIDEDGDSCWGYDDSKYAIEDAKGCIDHDIKTKQEAQCRQLKAYIKHKVPIDLRTLAKV